MAAASASSEPVATTQDEFAPPQFDDISLSAKPHTNVKGGRLPQHHHVYITVFEKGDPAQRKELWDTISRTKGLVEHLVSSRIVVDVAVAAFKTYPESRDTLWSALANCGERNTKEIATDPVGTLLLRAVMEVESERVGIEQQHQLAEAAVELSQDPVSSPVLQKLLECSQEQEAIASLIFERIRSELKCLVLHNSASYLVQALVQHCGHKLRSQLTKELLAAFDDMRHMLAFAQGSRVMQKLLAYGSDEVVAQVADLLLNAAEGSESKENNQLKGDEHNVNEEGQGGESDTGKGVNNSKLPRWKIREMNRQKHYTIESNAIISYALHSHACYVIQALLRECCSRALEVQRKRLMKELKPHVFELAVSPWAGRIVLGAMQQCGSPQLKEAMNNVVYLKAEAWLTDAGAKEKERGSGLDPTLRQTLRRVRKEDLGEQNASNDSPARKKPFRAPGR
uniref:Uncharacterized protein TCIL3000_11_15190 n=1 Tax=Trypanosoma congolense (strain IL3000) TaxID=1068625 RepID=G0V2X9_TRYCI|nr:unnamed protein product [Trypanosoma congolense IL3000]